MDKSCDKREIGREGEEEYGEIIIKEIKLKEQSILKFVLVVGGGGYRRTGRWSCRVVPQSTAMQREDTSPMRRLHQTDGRPDTSKRILLDPPFP